MTDHELLMLAAKAAGYQVEWVRNSGCFYRCEEEIGREAFDPLEDDGDALRLAVALAIEVSFFNEPNEVHASTYNHRPMYDAIEPYGDDRGAATRRAITRAAAAIGEAMP